VIIGAGLWGSVFAREMTNAGYKCVLVDKRKHTGGNLYSENVNGIDVHKYGPHIFHTNSDRIWNYTTRFTNFNRFSLHPKVYYRGLLFSFPINLQTLHQIYGIITPSEAALLFDKIKEPTEKTDLESWAISQVGRNIYEIFIEGHTIKQWGTHPSKLPASILKRIPIRTSLNDDYFDDKYQGIPEHGYTWMMKEIQADIRVILGVDFFKDRAYIKSLLGKDGILAYTGEIDRFFNYKFGKLEYRSLRFEEQYFEDLNDFQGTAMINYTDITVPYTRIVEHKHFQVPFRHTQGTVITKEYPASHTSSTEPLYPIRDSKNLETYRKYKQIIPKDIIVGGRLGEYQYYNMDQIIASALKASQKEKQRKELDT
jgi:UDP-galactopyranose mutase